MLGARNVDVTPSAMVEKPLALRAPTGHREFLLQTSDSGNWPVDLTRLAAASLESPLVAAPRAARAELVQLARRWTGQYASLDPPHEITSQHAGKPTTAPTLFLSGHQPELFHAGVWYKNFVLYEAAARAASQSVNLLIDQDLVKTNSLLVPTKRSGVWRRQRVAMDYGGVGRPFEERQVEHPDVLSTVPQRVHEIAAPWVPAELLAEMWPEVVDLSRELRGLGYGFAAARHRLEQTIGCQNLEVPLSWICQTVSFAQFVVRILQQLETFVAQYNHCLTAYRAWYGMRGTQRPIPNLVVQQDWHELPFWIWTAAQPVRRRLFARRTSDGWQWSAGQDSEIQVEAWRLDLDREFAVEQIVGFSELNVRLRPRALMTTLYARGVLSQAFLHGIGGALYDQMTDRLARVVWDLRLPPYVMATATMVLGRSIPDVRRDQWQALRQFLRDLHYSPERISDFAHRHPQWVAEKRRLLEVIPLPRRRQAWQRQVEELLTEARRILAPEIAETRSKLQELEGLLQEKGLMTNREWSFVLFEHSLPRDLQRMAQEAVREIK
jgi:hypothetical protein